jgi:hypothetical protein
VPLLLRPFFMIENIVIGQQIEIKGAAKYFFDHSALSVRNRFFPGLMK